MSEKEILHLQELSGNTEFYLMLVGKFLHAVGSGAFALSLATGYRVMRKKRKDGEMLVCGFPIEKMGVVKQRIFDHGGTIEEADENLFLFRGIDGTPDEALVCEPKSNVSIPGRVSRDSTAVHAGYQWLADEVLRFNLSMSTPLDAMLFLGTLQQRIKENDDDDKTDGADCPRRDAPGIACESPSGQGSTE
ncbi:MAG: hypothetical protein J6I61_10520 [Prevotella sp.]|nr:hypothetical protein [Prevotella sp.]